MKQALFYNIFFLTGFLVAFGTQATAQNRNIEFYIGQARAHNPAINEQQNKISNVQLQVDLAKSELTRPSIYGTADFLYAPVFGKFGYDNAVTNGGLYSVLLNIEYPLLAGSKLDIRKRRAIATGKKSAAEIKLIEHEQKRKITEQYITTYQGAARLKYLREVLDLMHQQKKVLHKLGSNGIAKITDITQMEIEIDRLKTEQKIAQSSYQQNLYKLNTLSGFTTTTAVDLLKPELKILPISGSSKFLQKFRMDSLELSLQQQVSELKYKPSLTAFGNTGLNTTQFSGFDHHYGFSTGFQFSLPIYDGHQKNINRQQIKLGQRSVKGYQQQFDTERQNKLNSLSYRLTKNEEQQVLIEHQILGYENLLKAFQKKLSQGELSIINYMTFLRNYIDARNQRVQNEGARLSLINEYNYWNW